MEPRDVVKGPTGRIDAPELLHLVRLHSDARLTPAEKTALINGLTVTIGPQAGFGGRDRK